MSRFGDWLSSHLLLRNIKRSERISKRCDARCQKTLRKFEKARKKIASLKRRMDAVAEALFEDIDESEATVKSLNESLEAVRSELEIANDVVIPGLVQSNKLLLERSSADTAEQVRRQVRNTVHKQTEE